MINHTLIDTIWTAIELDGQSNIRRIMNPDASILFGNLPEKPQGQPIGTLADNTDYRNRKQLGLILDGIRRAKEEKRNVYLEYTSFFPGEKEVPVTGHILYDEKGPVYIYITAIDPADLHRTLGKNTERNPYRIQEAVMRLIHENMPVGLELYDRDGYPIEIDCIQTGGAGMPDKSKITGTCLFDKPYISEEIKAQLQSGQHSRFTVSRTPDKKSGDNSEKNMLYFDTTVNVLRDEEGEILAFLVISRDITEQTLLHHKYENLHKHTETILNSLPVGVELYACDGTLLYVNDTGCRIFGIDKEKTGLPEINIYHNPILPDSIKSAVRKGKKIHTHFPYDFTVISENNYYNSSTQAGTVRQIECNGKPVINSAGETENYIFIVNDVTERVQAEEILRQSKQKTELAMQAADIMLWEFDCRTGLFIGENEPLNNYDRTKNLTVKDYIASIHPDDRLKAYSVLKDMTNGEDRPYSLDLRFLFPDNPEWQFCTINGTPYKKDANGRVIQYVGFRKNNTELKKKKILQDEILNAIPLPIQIKDVEDNFRYVFCNEESKQMFGTTEEINAYDILNKQEVERIQKNDMEVFRTGKPYFGKERIMLRNGRAYDTIVSKSVIYDNGKPFLLTIRWDQKLRNELKRHAKVLSISMDALNAYSWFYEPDPELLSFGEGFEKTGRDARQLNTMKKFASCLHPDDRKPFLDSMAEVLNRGYGDFSVEYRVDLTGNENYEWWECRGILETTLQNDIPYKYMYGMDINIESHKKTEFMLRRNQEELDKLIRQNELVLDNTNSGLAYITTDYKVQWENISRCSTSLSFEAYKKGEFCYKSAHNRTKPCENCVMQRAIASRQTERIKFHLENKRIVEVFATPIFNAHDNIDGIVIRVDDITEREQMIIELQRAKLQAEESDKLKSAFLANMSHEIRTPLNAIIGFSALLMNTDEETEKEEYMQIVNNNNELLLKLINDILDLSKIEAGSVDLKYEEFDLSEYFNGIVSLMKQRITNPEVKLIAANPYSKCLIKMDKNRIAQILTNYVTNAIKYTPKGFIEMGYEETDEGIRLYVKDSGIGIPEEKKKKVFHRFEKLDEFAQGTGLGLSICKAIAESIGGSVGFESQYGTGSLFWAVLPCTTEIRIEKDGKEINPAYPGSETANTGESSCGISQVRKTILIAEDIQSNYLLVSVLLRNKYELIHAINGMEAVEYARTRQIDLILMDMKMPVMDGLTATSEIRKFNPEIPIVALTAHAFEADRQKALETGCNDYLIKPIDKIQLKAVLQKYC